MVVIEAPTVLGDLDRGYTMYHIVGNDPYRGSAVALEIFGEQLHATWHARAHTCGPWDLNKDQIRNNRTSEKVDKRTYVMEPNANPQPNTPASQTMATTSSTGKRYFSCITVSGPCISGRGGGRPTILTLWL